MFSFSSNYMADALVERISERYVGLELQNFRGIMTDCKNANYPNPQRAAGACRIIGILRLGLSSYFSFAVSACLSPYGAIPLGERDIPKFEAAIGMSRPRPRRR